MFLCCQADGFARDPGASVSTRSELRFEPDLGSPDPPPLKASGLIIVSNNLISA